MAETFNPDFYTEGEAYDLAFSYRDIPAEVDFLEWAFREHAVPSGRPDRSFIDVCAGPSPHGLELARRGWRTTAVDLSPEMRAYTLRKAERAGTVIEYRLGDIRDFRLPRPSSAAGCFIDSLTHLTSNDEIVRHFRTMAANVRPGGLYFIELCHPRYVFPSETPEPNRWTRQSGEREVEVLYGLPSDPYDPVLQVWDLTTVLTIRSSGRIVRRIEGKAKHRFFMAQEFKALADLAGVFETCVFYGSFEVPPPPLGSDRNQKKMIATLRFKT